MVRPGKPDDCRHKLKCILMPFCTLKLADSLFYNTTFPLFFRLLCENDLKNCENRRKPGSTPVGSVYSDPGKPVLPLIQLFYKLLYKLLYKEKLCDRPRWITALLPGFRGRKPRKNASRCTGTGPARRKAPFTTDISGYTLTSV